MAEATRQMAARLAEFRDLRARSALCTEVTEQLATEAASSFLEHFQSTGQYLSDAIALLAEIATLEEPCLSQPGLRATFPNLIERMSDSFDPQQCLLYDRVFAQMISVVRQLPAGARLDSALRQSGLHTEQDLLDRKARLRNFAPRLDTAAQQLVKKVLVLSRVTLGADVAITSVVLQNASAQFPQAERVLLAPGKARELFGGDASLRIRETPYASSGTLQERLESWLSVAAAVETETRGLAPENYILIDPDSRYLQLGLLPALSDESRYFFFESRSAGADGTKTLSALTLDWLNETFGRTETILPRVWLRQQDANFGKQVCARLRSGGPQCIVAMSFGVGGNQEKRIGEPFENTLALRLIESSCTIVLDKGAGEEERAQAERIVEAVKRRGAGVTEISAVSSAQSFPPHSRLVTWHGGIGAWAGLIAAADEYVGYDSAGQHIAAACDVPTIDIFSSAAAPVFRARWQPAGSNSVQVVAEADRGHEAVIQEVLHAHRILKRKPPEGG